MLEEHIKRQQKKVPEHGEYEKPHKENEINGANIEFDKQVGRDDDRELDDLED